MKRSEFKAIVKECLVEILRDNMDVFQEAKAPKGRATKKAKAQSQQRVKRSLMNLVQEQAPRQRPVPQQQMHPQQQQKRTGPPSLQEMVLSAAATMNNQNANGEMSSRSVYETPSQQAQQPIDEGYVQYAAYENQAPMPQTQGMPPQQQQQQQQQMQAPSQEPYVPGMDQMDGDSHWAQLAFFDQ